MHTGENLNKCIQCDYASSRAGDLRTHMKNMHKITQPFHTQLWLHLKTHIKNELTIFLKYHLAHLNLCVWIPMTIWPCIKVFNMDRTG